MRSLSSKTRSLFISVQKTILDAFFPIRCLGCGTYDTWLCNDCHTTLPILVEQHCPLCKKHITPYGNVCFACATKSTSGLDGVFVVSHYHDPLLKKAIHHYKYRFASDIATPLALLVAQAIHHSTLPTPDMLIPVPLHKRRLRWRGFNQAEILAKALDLHIPILTDILIRRRYTAPQVSMKDQSARQKNLIQAFCVTDASCVHGKNILLIDDVMTTGTTLMECARTLKDAGAKTVHCLVLARE